MQRTRSWWSLIVVAALASSALALVVPAASASPAAAAAGCDCGCGGTPRPYCAYHKCPCNPSSTARLEGVVLETPNGAISLILPPDIAAGDTISGTVIVEPKEGQPKDVLDGYVIETPGKQHKLSGLRQILSFAVPSGIVPLVLRDRSGREVAKTQTPPPETLPPGQVGYPEGPPHAVKRGQGIPIGGSFDGIADTTKASLGGVPLRVVAESPRGVFVETEIVPLALTSVTPGPLPLRLEEQGQLREYKVNVLDLKLSADKLQLRQGERTQVHTSIEGAKGLGEGECSVELEMREGSAAHFAGARGDTFTHDVVPAKIGADGQYMFDTSVVATRPGGFTIVATLLAGNEKTFKFPNKTGQAVNDLHIEWSRAVDVKSDKPFGTTNGSGTSRTDHSDGNVANNGTGSVTVGWDGSMPKVKQWWWTKDGKQVGGKNQGNP